MIFEGDISSKANANKLRDPTAYRANIGRIIKGKSNGKDFNDFIRWGLEESVLKDGVMDAGSLYLNIFYKAAQKFNDKNLILN